MIINLYTRLLPISLGKKLIGHFVPIVVMPQRPSNVKLASVGKWVGYASITTAYTQDACE